MRAVSSASTQPLVDGEALTREAFERRYEAMPDARAELIEGIVYVTSPTKDAHAAAHGILVAWAGAYAARTVGVLVRDSMSYRIAEHSEVQPDLVVMRDPTQGGRARVDSDGFLVGAPELVVEVAVASLERDLEQKWRLYERAGVQEYLVWEAEARRLHAWSLEHGRYAPPELRTQGLWCSRAFAGLCLDVSALARLDLASVLKPYLSAR